jgi:hypothetical protein
VIKGISSCCLFVPVVRMAAYVLVLGFKIKKWKSDAATPHYVQMWASGSLLTRLIHRERGTNLQGRCFRVPRDFTLNFILLLHNLNANREHLFIVEIQFLMHVTYVEYRALTLHQLIGRECSIVFGGFGSSSDVVTLYMLCHQAQSRKRCGCISSARNAAGWIIKFISLLLPMLRDYPI